MTDIDVPDVNVLVALLHPAHIHHDEATAWFDNAIRFATTPITESGFLRVALNPAISGGTVDFNAARASLTSLRSDPRAEFLADDSTLAEPVIDVGGINGYRQVTDYHLVNLAAVNAGRLVTLDRRIVAALGDRHSGLVYQLI